MVCQTLRCFRLSSSNEAIQSTRRFGFLVQDSRLLYYWFDTDFSFMPTVVKKACTAGSNNNNNDNNNGYLVRLARTGLTRCNFFKHNNYIETKIITFTQTHSHTRAHTHTRARAHTHIYTHARTRTHARTHTHAHTHAHTRTHARTHAHTHTGGRCGRVWRGEGIYNTVD